VLPESRRAGVPAGPPHNALGEYLQARRALVSPDQAGIATTGTRRVRGLRREEVAMLAGISADYYLRLERGRDRNPSVQVLEALARVLRLDDTHVAHLLNLVCEVRREPVRTTTPPDGVLGLLRSLAQPAFLENRYYDVVAANDAARALSPRLVAGTNQLRSLFLDPADRSLYADWDRITGCLVANLRQAVGSGVTDPGLAELVGELRTDPWFRELWSRHDVQGQSGGAVRFDHPVVGPLTLNRERLAVAGAEDLMLVVFHADPGSADEAALTSILP
jgi:transcriptional regulator with XRE-family HTH domain